MTELRRAALALLCFLAALAAPLPAQASGPQGWSVLVNFSEQPGFISAFPILICDAGENTHALWVERKEDDTEAYLFYRTDAEGAWSPPRDALAQRAMYYLRAAAGPDGYLYALWTTNLISGDLMLARAPLTDAGNPRAWAQPIPLASGVRAGDLFIDARGALWVLYGQTDANATSHDLMLISSTDGGARWSAPAVVASFTTPVPATLNGNILVDETGRGHIAWGIRSFEYGAYSRLGYLRSGEGMAQWGEPVEFAAATTPPGVDVPKVFAFGPGEIHLTWSEPARRHIISTDGGATWSAPATIIDLGAAFGGYNQLAKDGRGVLYAITAVGDGVYSSRNTGGGWGPAEEIDRRAFDPHGQQLVLCQGNRLHVAYYDRTGETEIWYATRTIDAPGKARGPIPAVPAAQPAAPRSDSPAPSPTTAPPAATQQVGAAVAVVAPVAATGNAAAPAAIGGAAAAAVIALVVLIERARRNRGWRG